MCLCSISSKSKQWETTYIVNKREIVAYVVSTLAYLFNDFIESAIENNANKKFKITY